MPPISAPLPSKFLHTVLQQTVRPYRYSLLRSFPVRFWVIAFLLLGSTLSGQSKSSVARTAASKTQGVKPSYAAEAFVIRDSASTYRYMADGTAVQDLQESVKVQTESGARAFSVISATYAGAAQTAKMVSVRVTHADGSVTVTPPSDAIDQPAPVTQQAPLYSDLKVLQLPVRGLRPGDTLDFHLQILTNKPEVPGEFWDSFRFFRGMVVLHETVTLDVPDGKYVQVWSPSYKPVVSDNNGRHLYTWTYNQLQPTSSDKSGTSIASTKPDLS